MTVLLTFEKSLEPDAETLAAWASPSGYQCLLCKKEITVGEYEAAEICSDCYFKEVGVSK